MNFFRIILLSLFTVALFGCEKPVDLEKATVVDWGTTETTGCGFMVELADGTVVHPTNLPLRFRQDGLEIGIEYSLERDAHACGWLTVMYHAITLESVQKW